MSINPEAGTWYVVVTCENCNSEVVLFRDLTQGKSSLDARYWVTCPSCGHEGEHQARHYQHPEKAN